MRIERGIVLDHLPAWKATGLVGLLGLEQKGLRVALLLAQSSAKLGTKDILMVEDYRLSELEEQRLALYAPDATLNFVEKQMIVRKKRPYLPLELHQIVVCANPRCITRAETVPHRIQNIGPRGSALKCHYCQCSFTRMEAEFV